MPANAIPELTSKLGGTRLPWRWRGNDLWAAQAGEGPFVLLVHGIYAGSSSYEFRKLFPLLAREHRVVAIDLLGCGLSERPEMAYSADVFVDQVVDAIMTFGPNAAAVIGGTLGAAYAVRAAARLPGRVASLGLICPTGLAGSLDGPPSGAQIGITKLIMRPGIGQLLFNGLASRPSLRWFLQNQAYADPKSATPEIVEDYWIATHQPGSRYVPAHFVGGALNCSIAVDLPRLDIPVQVDWGEHADGPCPFDTAPQYVGLARKGQLSVFANSRLLPHEEEPELMASRFAQFIAEANV